MGGARGIAVCRAADGGFAILCENFQNAGTLSNAVVKIDAAGNIQWQHILDNPSLHNGFQAIVAAAGGGFAVVGHGRSMMPVPDFYARLVRLDEAGNLLWEQSLGLENSTTELPQALVEMPNGDLVVAGDVRGAAPVEGESDFFMARFNAQGNLLWQQQYAHAAYQKAYDLLSNPDGSLVLLGETYQTDPVRMTLLKTDGNGAEIWHKISLPTLYSTTGPQNGMAHQFARDAAGNLYVPFYTDDSGVSTGLSLVKLNAGGDSSWIHTSDATDYPEAILYSADHYFIIAGRTGAEQAMLLKSDWLADSLVFFNTLSGVLYWDQNADCVKQTGEPAPPQFIVEAENQFGEKAYQSVSANGQYQLHISAGDYSLTVRPLAGTETLWSACDTPVVSVAGSGQNLTAPELGVQSVIDCPYLEVELGAGLFRRCTTSSYVVNYCNFGTAAADGAYVELTVHPYFSYISSSIPLSAQNGNTYRFNLSSVPPGHCDYFYATFELSCEAQHGQTFCAEAHIFPDTICEPQNVQWDGSHLEVSAACNGDAEFIIRNTGADMTGLVDYVIIEDQIMYMQGQVQLPARADSVIIVPNPSGQSYYIRVNQRPGHPGQSKPTAVADECNGQSGSSLALQLPLDQDDPFLSIYCATGVGSFDPNDKQGFPLGWRAEHYLERGQEIDYMIRFQNTGTDTAFLVMIRDTLPATLDPATVRPGAASHPYTFDLSGAGVLKFTFGNILLPDSTTNEPASHGFVRFRVAQQAGLPDGTRIENRAAIYFDFNEPVITNTYFHTIGYSLISSIAEPFVPGALDVSVFPNPAGTQVHFKVNQPVDAPTLRFQLFNALGQTLRSETFGGASYRFERDGLAPGLYYFRLESTSGAAASGRLILR